MSNIIGNKRNKCNDGYYDLIEYTPDWHPWTHAILHFVDDGKHYQRPGIETCTGWTNYINVRAAWEAFDNL